jgi:hypothetical protein
MGYDRALMRLIRELSEHHVRSGRCFVSIQLLRNMANATPMRRGACYQSPFRKCPPTIRGKFNAGGGNRTHTGVPPQRILSPQRLPRAWRGTDMALGLN